MSRPLQISPDTAVKLAEQLGVPLEHLMHMPRHILLQKLAELSSGPDADASRPPSSGNKNEPGAQGGDQA
ncbi:YycC family protein [Paenibacillus sp. IB182496]|uniref:YycC family protein n=1 Tax=Paenibacillus sabuli TaxID=2772509 RepID=A0A927GQJ2_9BACL|nr:YycC family protein [Paenibacillus sabuli]MBD2844336.1 YycC family protein [Paenibacillus sabuli]